MTYPSVRMKPNDHGQLPLTALKGIMNNCINLNFFLLLNTKDDILKNVGN